MKLFYICLLSCLLLFTASCDRDQDSIGNNQASNNLAEQQLLRTKDALGKDVTGTTWIRVGINDGWEFKAGGVISTSEGLTGSWQAIDANTVVVTFTSFYAVSFDDSLDEATARTKGAVQKLVRNSQAE